MENNKKKIYEAVVSSNKKSHEGTLIVSLKRTFKHRIVKKPINVWKRYAVEYPSKKDIEVGTKVLIRSCAPVSKTKHFIVVEEK